MPERVIAAEARATDLQAIIDRELAGLRATVSMLAAQRAAERMRTQDSGPESHRSSRPRRRGLLSLFGR